MERNHIIGFVLIFAVLFMWSEFFYKPTVVKKAQEKKMADSLALAESKQLEAAKTAEMPVLKDSLSISATDSSGGAEMPIQEEFYSLKNKLSEITISNKGAKISKVHVFNYKKIIVNAAGNEEKTDLYLLEDPKNKFEYRIESPQGSINTGLLFYKLEEQSENQIRLRATLPSGGSVVQTYRLRPDDYTLDYTVRLDGVSAQKDIVLYTENYLDKIEKNYEYERVFTSVYYKEVKENADYCSCRSDDLHDSKEKAVQWISYSNQFFNSTIIPSAPFNTAQLETVMLQENSEDLKLLKSTAYISASSMIGKDFEMKYYIGPNEYDRLASFENHLQDIIPYGWSVFGTINRYVILPLFSFLNSFMGNMGIIILLMTFIVKLVVFPLAYKMLQSQAKMTALKPEIDKLKAKNKDDLQQQQVETMKLYNEFGVNPLGGCFPLLLQMPIWIALYRFFPATIEFRQSAFLWATDLTSYDEFLKLPFTIPFFGDTLSLFAFLWVISTIVFTYYSSKSMDLSANPAMLYMQYLMPLLFWFMFNKTAAGLTCYMFFSNILNIAQTIIGKNYLFDHNKIREKLEFNKSKPKKKGGFQEKLQEMIKEKQKLEIEKAKNQKKK
ncbi:MAG: membrane protein insertase YidC [Saprospiraceae bacterium]|nr:membrane protein insertase YidC [Saprospiraceae bacterium]